MVYIPGCHGVHSTGTSRGPPVEPVLSHKFIWECVMQRVEAAFSEAVVVIRFGISMVVA